MRWDFIVEHWTARLLADQALISVMGAATGWVGPAQADRPVKIPSIEYTRISDRDVELFNQATLQVDFWASGIKKAAQIERRIRLLTHRDTTQILGGERLWMRFADARTLDYPAQPGVVHTVLDFELEAVREKYLTA